MPRPKTTEDFEVRGDFDTLVRADEIFNDKKRLKKALDYGEEQKESISNVVKKGLSKLKK